VDLERPNGGREELFPGLREAAERALIRQQPKVEQRAMASEQACQRSRAISTSLIEELGKLPTARFESLCNGYELEAPHRPNCCPRIGFTPGGAWICRWALIQAAGRLRIAPGGKILLQDPDLLLLMSPPTNLDVETFRWPGKGYLVERGWCPLGGRPATDPHTFSRSGLSTRSVAT